MCITLKSAKLTNTFVYAGEAKHPVTDKYIHVIAYQNQADNQSKEKNAMILPFPNKSPMGPENIIDTLEYPNFLKEMGSYFQNRSFSKSRGLSDSMRIKKSIQVFKSGGYTVALASNSKDIAIGINALPKKIRPRISLELSKAFGEIYKDYSVAICAWDGKIKAEPLLWWYEPIDPNHLFIPALDAHNGGPPILGENVSRDHILMVGSKINPFGLSIKLDKSKTNKIEPYITTECWGVEISGMKQNSDYRVSTNFNIDYKNIKFNQFVP